MSNDTIMPVSRRCILRRKTRETEVLVDLDLDGAAAGGDRGDLVRVATGIGFLDHLVGSLAFHAGWRLELRCAGDLEIDDHHSAEDCALLLGEALSRAVGRGPAPLRFGSAYAPLDEALSRAVVDFSGRPSATVELELEAGRIGDLAAENVTHFLASLATAARMTLHVDVLRGDNSHHRAESAFKALALALRQALSLERARPSSEQGESSTKGGVVFEELDRAAFEAAASGLRSVANRSPGDGPPGDPARNGVARPTAAGPGAANRATG
jgi:imidazoleglycerol-phosphate dehydratase